MGINKVTLNSFSKMKIKKSKNDILRNYKNLKLILREMPSDMWWEFYIYTIEVWYILIIYAKNFVYINFILYKILFHDGLFIIIFYIYI